MRVLIFTIFLLLIPFTSAASVVLDAEPNGVIYATVYDTNYYDTKVTPLDIQGHEKLIYIGEITRIEFQETIKFRSVGMISVADQKHVFSNDFMIKEPSSISLMLPEGFILADIETPALPSPTIESDGRRIILTWERAEDFSAIVVYERSFEKQYDAVPLIIIILVCILAIIVVLFVLKTTKKSLRQTLGDNELSLIRLLGSNQGVMKQKDIVQKSRYSKSRVSKLLARLEDKGFIERTEQDGFYKIKLKKRV